MHNVISWSQIRLPKSNLAIAVLLALLLFAVPIASTASPLLISEVSAQNVLNTQSTITWTTDVPATSVVNYGNTTDLGLSAYDSTMVTSHSVTLHDLKPNNVYYYEVQSTDSDSNTIIDNNGNNYYTFTTTDFMTALTKPIGQFIVAMMSQTSNALDDFVNLSATEPLTQRGSDAVANLAKIVVNIFKNVARLLNFLN